MPKIRNISGGDLDLRAPGFERLVADGETVDAPDFQPDGISPLAYPPRKWEIVPEPKVAPEPRRARAPKAAPAPDAGPAPDPAPSSEPARQPSSDPRER